MKYKKGSKVEVLNKREVPSGSWWCAEIISGNGHTYSVRYDSVPSGVSELIERVPRKVIRPCPPLVQDPVTLIRGDIIEVFDNGSWKLAEVSDTVATDCFSVRVLGSSRVFDAEKSDIRLRQCWSDNQWIVMDKDIRNSESTKILCHKRSNHQVASGSERAENGEEITAFENPKLMFLAGMRKALEKKYLFQKPSRKVLKKTKIRVSKSTRRRFLAYVEMPSRKQNGDFNHSFIAPVEQERSELSITSSCGSNELPMFYPYPLFSGASLEDDLLLADDANSTGWSRF